MLKEVTTIDDIKKLAVVSTVNRPFRVTDYFEHYTTSLYMNYISELEGCYNSNNSIVAFVSQGNLYFIPYTYKIKGIITLAFNPRMFPIPLSSWDLPADDFIYWQNLLEEAKEINMEAFHTNCLNFSKIHSITPLTLKELEKCLKFDEVIEVRRPFDDKSTYLYPSITGWNLDFFVQSKLGRYEKNHGTIVFFNADGIEYLTQDTSIIPILKKHGFTSIKMAVPLSDGKLPVKKDLLEKWLTSK